VSFISEKPIKAVRKVHVCSACDKWIEIGEPAVNWCGVTDGDFGSVHYHPDCRKAEVAYNREYLDSYYDEWVSLAEAEHDDRPWIKENWPVPYLRMCMSRAQWRAQPHEAEQPRSGTAATILPVAADKDQVGHADRLA
jgi:hypothetical protein